MTTERIGNHSSRCEVLPRWRSSIVKNSVPGTRFRWRRVRVLRAIVLASVSYRNNPVTVDVLRISAAGEKPAGWTSPAAASGADGKVPGFLRNGEVTSL